MNRTTVITATLAFVVVLAGEADFGRIAGAQGICPAGMTMQNGVCAGPPTGGGGICPAGMTMQNGVCM